ncbi:glutathione S-transferase [Boeremia exigua]|uniref:glutathione S-transferase n=1 Tax=Boeremia exigua TaxID=749465 RepID=UPI001E8DBD15|nr:glutathione S-transferase [Boeremia exigua]KAH6633805.1 glutathione S-transferase [Boeremia exigua]
MADSNSGTITIFIDCVSPYSWFGFINIKNFRPLLTAHGIEVFIEPFFLGGARDGVGNPFTPPVPAKATFGEQDLELTSELLGLKVIRPEVFPISSLFPVRLARYVKDHYSAKKFEETFLGLVSGYWGRNINISTPEGVLKALEVVFPAHELEEIIKKALSAENKKRVVDTTMSVGAFGAPWIIAVNRNGERRDWFGNDRWNQVFHHLKVPYTPVTILPPSQAKSHL